MTKRLKICPTGPVRGTIRPPGSKSITNRVLLCAALADGTSTLFGSLESEDTTVMVNCLRSLGANIEGNLAGGPLTVVGCNGKWPQANVDLFVGNSGTTIRFLTAAVALGSGHYRLDGIPRMRERPIGDLIETLIELNVDVEAEIGNGCPPVLVRANGLSGGHAVLNGNLSSQFLSGLLMTAPYATRDVELSVHGTLVSKPYVTMTIAVMSEFGVAVQAPSFSNIVVTAGQTYQAVDYSIEPDASAASYFWAAAAITGGEVTVEGLSTNAIQGDVAFCHCLEKMGCDLTISPDSITVTGKPLKGISVDMNAISDTAQTLAAVALFADGPTELRGIAHVRHKETDRIGDLAIELRKLGARIDQLEDGLRITPATLQGTAIETYGDHRMAMSLALVGLRIPSVEVCDPGCTAKTYPDYFKDLETLCQEGSG